MGLYLNFPTWIDPYIFSFLPIRWYALMYIIAFFITYLLFRYQVKHDGVLKISSDESESLFFYAIVGLVIGARVFSCLFYSDTTYYLTHPWMMFWPFRNGHFVGLPGMSYHGGALGCFIGGLTFKKTDTIDSAGLAVLTATNIGSDGSLNYTSEELYR